MTTADRDAFVEILVTLGDLYSKKLSQNVINLYFSCLYNESLDDVKKALRVWVMQPRSLWPTPGNIKALIDNLPPVAKRGVPYYENG